MNRLLGSAFLAAILLSGCGADTAKEIESSSDKVAKVAKAVETKAEVVVEKKVVPKVKAEPATAMVSPHKKSEKTVAPLVSKFYKIFKDSAKIATDGKEMLLLFGQDSDAYTQKIKDDIVSDDALSSAISTIVTPIYIDARGQKRHKFQHNGEMMDVDTKTLISIYNVTATPTLIFTDKEASHIFVVPGYMPPKQFKVTLEFIKQGLWKGKDRKNGDVYKVLKEFYIKNGVEIKGAK